MATRSQLGRRARQKGKAAQKIVARKIANMLEVEEDEVRSCVGGKAGADEEDVWLGTIARAKYPYHTEVKNQKRLNVKDWIKQAEEESGWRVPTVVFHMHGDPTDKFYVVLPFDKWLEVARAMAEKIHVAMGTTKSPNSSSVIRELWREAGIELGEDDK